MTQELGYRNEEFEKFEAEIQGNTGSYIFEHGKKVEVIKYDPADDLYLVWLRGNGIWVTRKQLKIEHKK